MDFTEIVHKNHAVELSLLLSLATLSLVFSIIIVTDKSFNATRVLGYYLILPNLDIMSVLIFKC